MNVQTEDRLVSIIREGRLLLDRLKVKNVELAALVPSLPKGSVARAEAIEFRDEVLSCIAKLKAEIKASEPLAIRIASNGKWAKAVFVLFGDEGLAKCYTHMKGRPELIMRG